MCKLLVLQNELRKPQSSLQWETSRRSSRMWGHYYYVEWNCQSNCQHHFLHSVHSLLEKDYGCCCVSLSLFMPIIYHSCSMIITQMVHIHNYSCLRKWYKYIYQWHRKQHGFHLFLVNSVSVAQYFYLTFLFVSRISLSHCSVINTWSWMSACVSIVVSMQIQNVPHKNLFHCL
jgi:hypothetical protein